MAYFTQVDYPDMPGNTAFITAQANLLQFLGLGHDTTPVELDEFYLTSHVYETERNPWAWLTRYDSTIRIDLLERGWPSQSPAIVKFHCLSVENPTTVIDGVQVPNFIDHYAILIDHAAKTIIDSYDGDIKSGEPYGDPVSYAIYTTPEYSRTTEPDPSFCYTWRVGDVLPLVAKRLGFTRQELMEHNNLDELAVSKLIPGDILHLPAARESTAVLEIRYQPLTDENGNPERRDMHIQAIDGAHKWGFANVKTWDDLTKVGFYPCGANLVVTGVAFVPVQEPDGTIVEAKYYMASTDFGDYIATGRVRYTAGFGAADVIPGKRVAVMPEPLPVPKPLVPEPQSEAVEPEPEPELEPATEPDYHDSYQETIRPVRVVATITEDLLQKAEIPEGYHGRDERGTFILVHRYDGKGEHGKLYNNWHGTINATVIKDGVSYAVVERGGHTWELPLDFLESEATVYDTQVDLATRIATGRLTTYERFITEPLFRAVHKPRKKRLIFKYKK